MVSFLCFYLNHLHYILPIHKFPYIIQNYLQEHEQKK